MTVKKEIKTAPKSTAKKATTKKVAVKKPAVVINAENVGFKAGDVYNGTCSRGKGTQC